MFRAGKAKGDRVRGWGVGYRAGLTHLLYFSTFRKGESSFTRRRKQTVKTSELTRTLLAPLIMILAFIKEL